MSTKCSTVRKPNAVVRGMARHPSLFALIFAVVVSIIANYGDSFSSKPMEVPPRQPSFWFSPHSSVVIDSPRGSLLPVITRLSQDEVIFVMFYAPWCSRSVKAKAEFEKAAVILQGKVTFAAVNCWWPEGECSKQYKFLMFPVFMAYHTTLDGFKFIGGARADHMVKFVESLLHPVTLVNSVPQVQELIARHDFVVFGFFNLVNITQSGCYRQFYYASMRILEKDPFQPVHFAVVSCSQIASVINLHSYKDIVMAGIGRNTTVYPLKTNITSSNLVSWSLKSKGMPVVKRLSPLGVKSRLVADEINKGPALILFHQENVLFRAEPSMHLMKEVALQYRACNLSVKYRDMHRVWRKISRDDAQHYDKVVEMCRLIRTSNVRQKHDLRCCVSMAMKSLRMKSLTCDVCKASNLKPCDLSHDYISARLSQTPITEGCRTTAPSYVHRVKLDICCQNSSSYRAHVTEWVNYSDNFQERVKDMVNTARTYSESKSTGQRRLTDRFYLDHLENLPRRLCHGLAAHHNQNFKKVWDLEEELAVNPSLEKQFLEESCMFNRSLNFYSIDSNSHQIFSERLGLSSLDLAHPGVVIFDKTNEEHFIMRENLTVSNTMSFILDFQRGNLQRHTNAHSFSSESCEGDGSSSICVRELDSTNFLHVVKDEKKDVVVLIYAHWCGFCQTLSHTFLALARYFTTSKHISFVRINGATNDLPWEYSVDSFPAVLFFPAQRKADSVMFPPWKEKSLTNLIRFVLRHTTVDTKLLLATDVCGKSCIRSNLHRSQALMQQLRGKYMRTRITSENILKILQAEKENEDKKEGGHDYYLKLSYEYLSKRLSSLNERVKNVKKLVTYLRKSENGVIKRKEFIGLFSV